ncbi:MAG: glycerophosphoryl diester phosphodiesterase membrane domain-containing protein [Clostridiales bacterium]|jgi:hypothetical protein|nr:glycerophosphoryl diester phosphodiesterase membrane domain-containing protein [Clostridiales bacterium]
MPFKSFSPMNAAELMDAVFDVYKKSFVKNLVYSLILLGLYIAMMFVGIIAAVIVTVTAIVPMVNESAYATPSEVISVVLIIAVPVLLFVLVWVALDSAGRCVISRNAFYGTGKLTARGMLRTVLRVAGTIVIQLVCSIPLFTGVGAIIYLFMDSAFQRMDTVSFLTAFASSNTFIVISILTALAYVVYSNVFSLSVPVSVFERRTFHRALARSWRLLKGDFWKILGLRLLWSVTVYLFSYSAQGLAVTVTGLIDTAGTGIAEIAPFAGATGMSAVMAVSLIMSLLTWPLEGIFTSLLYFNQRIKKEGLDMEIAVEQLSETPAEPSATAARPQ